MADVFPIDPIQSVRGGPGLWDLVFEYRRTGAFPSPRPSALYPAGPPYWPAPFPYYSPIMVAFTGTNPQFVASAQADAAARIQTYANQIGISLAGVEWVYGVGPHQGGGMVSFPLMASAWATFWLRVNMTVSANSPDEAVMAIPPALRRVAVPAHDSTNNRIWTESGAIISPAFRLVSINKI